MRIGINALLASTEPSYRSAGISRYILSLLQALGTFDQANEYSVFVSDPAVARQLQAMPSLRVISSGRLTRRPATRVLWEHLLLARDIRRHELSMLHAPMNVLPLRLPCPALVTVHDLAFLRFPEFFRPARRRYQSFFTRRSAGRATLLIAVSEHTRRDLIELLGVPEERVRVIYPMLEERFSLPCSDEMVSAFRQRRGLQQPYILFLGTLEPRKNIKVLLEAFALLKRETTLPHSLVLAGATGWYAQSLEQRVRELKLQGQVHFAGYVLEEEKTLWYHAAELFVYPSHYEGFGLPVAEAMACGVPVVTSNVSSLPEVVGNDAEFGARAALTAAPDDPEALADAMRQEICDLALRQRLRERGLARVQRFAPACIVGQLIQAYQDAASPII